ncbi:MAG: lysine--tRNA ligase [Alphaproteobacteria bacterium]|nr:lysine--tRNA ligase [Alphaproteobacteria bacterium]
MSDREAAAACKAWPFQEAQRVLQRIGGKCPEKGYVLFETGYGPSGLPHIGTFAEVVRTTMVRHAFATLSDVPTRLFAFSDDMDGLRKVPDNVPNQSMLSEYLGKPLTAIPDPFETHESFGHHNNARLCAFLDSFGFDYTFQSATECYKSGRFDPVLRKVLEHYDAILNAVLPILGKERQATYSPFLPISPKTGHVLQTPVIARDVSAGTITFEDEDGTKTELPVTAGHCKLQWRVDWAMRWTALGVDYEMSGKDLIDSVRIGNQICRILGGTPPEGFTYELFLDENGEKISKSKGNGLSVEEWLRYAPPESLKLFMYQSPRKAKRLYFDVIPRNVDDYLSFLAKYEEQSADERLANPVWHIHEGSPPRETLHMTYSILLNLASACHAEESSVIWGYLSRYAPTASPETEPILDALAQHAVHYYQDFIKPTKRYRAPNDVERAALEDLAQALEALPTNLDAEGIQTEVYEVGKRHPFPELKAWFKALYEILLGQSQGPRMGSFIVLYGRAETVALIRRALAGALLGKEDVS